MRFFHTPSPLYLDWCYAPPSASVHLLILSFVTLNILWSPLLQCFNLIMLIIKAVIPHFSLFAPSHCHYLVLGYRLKKISNFCSFLKINNNIILKTVLGKNTSKSTLRVGNKLKNSNSLKMRFSAPIFFFPFLIY